MLHGAIGDTAQQSFFNFPPSSTQNNWAAVVFSGLPEQVMAVIQIQMGKDMGDPLLRYTVVGQDGGMVMGGNL